MIIHAPRLKDRFATHFFTTDQFYEDAAKGELPAYSFIEPQSLHATTTCTRIRHLSPSLTSTPPPRSLQVRLCSPRCTRRSGPGHLGVELSEHAADDHLRRARRHLRPRAPHFRRPPDLRGPAGQMASPSTVGRQAPRDRHLAVDPPTDGGERDLSDTSVIRDAARRWSLGAPFTARDANAADLASRLRPRPPPSTRGLARCHPQAVAVRRDSHPARRAAVPARAGARHGELALAEPTTARRYPRSPTPPHSTAPRDSMSSMKPLETCFQV